MGAGGPDSHIFPRESFARHSITCLLFIIDNGSTNFKSRRRRYACSKLHVGLGFLSMFAHLLVRLYERADEQTYPSSLGRTKPTSHIRPAFLLVADLNQCIINFSSESVPRQGGVGGYKGERDRVRPPCPVGMDGICCGHFSGTLIDSC